VHACARARAAPAAIRRRKHRDTVLVGSGVHILERRIREQTRLQALVRTQAGDANGEVLAMIMCFMWGTSAGLMIRWLTLSCTSKGRAFSRRLTASRAVLGP
jgi:hypothetical protein